MSDVVQGTPQPTYSAAQLAGDEGGHACATTGPAAGWIGWIGALALATVRRRRGLAAGLLAAGLFASAPAQADEPRHDETPARGNVEVRYGTIDYWPTPEGPGVVDVYGEGGHDLLQIEAGAQVLRFLELDFGVGFYQDIARTTDATGEAESSEIAMLTWYPISLDATLRGHVIDEQFLVPFGRLGLDYILWNEEREVGEGSRDKRSGGKAGWHYGFGIDILLDTFSPGRASLLEANTGINDTWVVVEWRRQIVEPGEFLWFDNSEGLSFAGDMITVGLKLDF